MSTYCILSLSRRFSVGLCSFITSASTTGQLALSSRLGIRCLEQDYSLGFVRRKRSIHARGINVRHVKGKS